MMRCLLLLHLLLLLLPAAAGQQMRPSARLDALAYLVQVPSAPVAPAGLEASDGTYTDRVLVTWSAPAWAETYTLYRATVNDFGAATALAAGLTATSYQDTSVVDLQVYYYWVRAANSLGSSPVSAAASGYADASSGYSPSLVVYVDPAYSGVESGTQAQPYNTLQEARDAIRASTGRTVDGTSTLPGGWDGARVVLADGTYELSSGPLVLDERDSGTAAAPVLWEAAPGATPVFAGSVALPSSGWSRVTSTSDPWAFGKLPVGAVNGGSSSVWRFDCGGLGIDTGAFNGELWAGRDMLALVVGGKLRLMSRWPSASGTVSDLWAGAETEVGGWTTFGTVAESDYHDAGYQNGFDWDGTSSDPRASWIRPADSTPTWWSGIEEQNIFLYGFLGSEWQVMFNNVVGASGGRLYFSRRSWEPIANSNSSSRKVCLINAMQALQPGTYVWCYDTRVIYYWPTAEEGDVAPASARATVGDSILVLGVRGSPAEAAHHVHFRGVAFSGARAWQVQGYDNVGLAFVDCHFGETGGGVWRLEDQSGLRISGGTTLRAGAYVGNVQGGDVETLTQADIVIEDHVAEEIGFYARGTYPSALSVTRWGTDVPSSWVEDYSCGVTVSRVTLRKVRGAGIGYDGPYNTVEDSLFEWMPMILGDAGALGSQFSYLNRHTKLVRNTFRHIRRHPRNGISKGALYAVYCDTQAGVEISDNYFEDCEQAINLASGYGVLVARNKFVGCGNGHYRAPVVFGSRATYTGPDQPRGVVSAALDAIDLDNAAWTNDPVPAFAPTTAQLKLMRTGGSDYWTILYHRDVQFVDNMNVDADHLAVIPDAYAGSSREAYVGGFLLGVDETDSNYPRGDYGTPAAGGGSVPLRSVARIELEPWYNWGAWYSSGRFVQHNGLRWRCIQSHSSVHEPGAPGSESYWVVDPYEEL